MEDALLLSCFGEQFRQYQRAVFGYVSGPVVSDDQGVIAGTMKSGNRDSHGGWEEHTDEDLRSSDATS